jgi:hypothetical protein
MRLKKERGQMEFRYIAIGLCLILGGFLLLKEWQRANKARMVWRLLASIVAVLCFALFIFPISYQVERPERPHELNLLSTGVSKDTVFKLKGRLLTADTRLHQSLKMPKLGLIPDLPYFLKSQPEINHLNIYGYGLTADELPALQGYQLNFHPPATPKGLISASWNSRMKSSETLSVQGIYNQEGDLPVKLLLQGLGENVDSLIMKTKGENTFSLKGKPKQTGRAVYHLIALQGKDTLAKEPVPVEVQPAMPLKILLLAAHPDFEYKFLKNWLFEKQYPLIFRSRISKDKYSTDFLNTENTNVSKINSGLLNKTDLLVIDEEELGALSGEELASIRRAVDSGLGLLLRITGLKATTAMSKGFERYESPELKNKTLTVQLPEQNRPFGPLPAEQAVFLRTAGGTQPLLTEKKGKVLASSKISGMGKVTATVVPATYHWLLNGQTGDYSDFWSTLLTHTARKTASPERWSIDPAVPIVRQRINITVDLDAEQKAPLISENGFRLSPLQNIELPFQWQVSTWATEHGWNKVNLNGRTEFFYVYKEQDWQQQRNMAKLKATAAFVKGEKNTDKLLETNVLIKKKVSMWWFFFPFLMAVTFLWYETKML